MSDRSLPPDGTWGSKWGQAATVDVLEATAAPASLRRQDTGCVELRCPCPLTHQHTPSRNTLSLFEGKKNTQL